MKSIRSELMPFYEKASDVLPGKAKEALLSLITVLSQGHLLIEDVPGMGKTTLVRFMGKALGFDFRRIQFTNDLLPADILGVSIYRPEKNDFHFKPGPIFAEIVLADELNRAPPKTQSALLQAMEERNITIEGVDYPLKKIFTVMATQNPRGMSGTFPLPESQLDRFLMKISMGLPSREDEKVLLKGPSRRDIIEHLASIYSPVMFEKFQLEIEKVKTSEAIIDYVMRLLETSRSSNEVRLLSPRAGLDLIKAAKSCAWVNNRDFVIPDDIQFVFAPVIGHRLPFQELGCLQEYNLANDLLKKVLAV
ncbi:MAG: AAA family ATPase [Bacteriovoracaceae bacterium]|nr:AAA family ATPase [Bacteriovoracaceae bacterium]